MANIILRLSGGVNNIEPNDALGGSMGTDDDAIITTSNTNLNNLWDDITKVENSSQTVDYRCVMIHNDTNTSGAVFAEGASYLDGTSKAAVTIGYGSINSPTVTIPDENTAPAGITFSAASSSSPLVFPGGATLNPDDYLPIWIKRQAQNISGSGTITDVITLVVKGVE